MKEVPISYHLTEFNGSFMQESVFRKAASPEVDEAWQGLGVDCKFQCNLAHLTFLTYFRSRSSCPSRIGSKIRPDRAPHPNQRKIRWRLSRERGGTPSSPLPQSLTARTLLQLQILQISRSRRIRKRRTDLASSRQYVPPSPHPRFN